MKLYTFFFVVLFFSIIFISCSKDESDVNSSVEVGERVKSLAPNYQKIYGGFFLWQDYNGFDISNYGPHSDGGGWKAIGLSTRFDKLSNENWFKANSSDYNPKVAILWREAIAQESGWYNLSNVHNDIDNAQRKGANWVYIDDLLTAKYSHTLHPDSIAKYEITSTAINDICEYAHTKGLLVAVSEDCATVYMGNEYMLYEWPIYQKVDIIMPYGYDRYIFELNDFYSFIRSMGKTVVPILAYHASKPRRDNINPDTWCYQLGLRGNNYGGFIELARSYSQTVFYYYEPAEDLTRFKALTTYLKNNSYLNLY